MNRNVKYWLVSVGAAGALVLALVFSLNSTYTPCAFAVCPGSDFADVRIRRVAATIVLRARWTAMREAADLALAARVVPRANVGADTPVWFEPGLPDTVRKTVQKKLAAEYAAHGSRPGRALVAVLVITDTATSIDGAPIGWKNSAHLTTRALLPSAATGGRCVSVLRLGKAGIAGGVHNTLERPLLDACGFYDAFGVPGTAIGESLERNRYQSARRYLPTMPDTLRRFLARRALAGSAWSDETGAFMCAAGADSACAAHIVALAGGRPNAPGSPGGEFTGFNRYRENSQPTTDETYTGQDGGLYDLIASDVGPADFARIWHSDAPLDDAFREVTGRSVATVAQRVSLAGTFPDARPSGFGVRVTVSRSAMLGSTALTVLAIAVLGIGTAIRSRRPRAS